VISADLTVRSDHEIRKKPTDTMIALLATPFGISLERSTSRSCSRRHSPRSSRNQRAIPFRPGPTPGFPIPRYLENVLWLRTSRTRTPVSSFSNSSLSPARTPRIFRTSGGTVIRPLLVIVIVACLCIEKPQFLTLALYPYWENHEADPAQSQPRSGTLNAANQPRTLLPFFLKIINLD
jgi:hypothetical protein